MAEEAVVKKPNEPEPGAGFAGIAGACVLAIVLAGMFAFSSLSEEGEFVLDSRINPNTAPLGRLMQLPKIGAKKAQTIVEYRNGFEGETAFENVEDLQKIKGIGPKTAETIGRWLVFE